MHSKVRIIEYDCIGSTNAEAKKYAVEAYRRDPTLFLAREQSAGRGRLGRSFVSRRDSGIYMSLLYFTDSALSDAISVTTAAAVFTAKAIEAVTDEEMKIKWVNDIYNSRGKVAGILTETVLVGKDTAVVVGIGINTGNDDFPEELCGIAASIGEIDEGQRNSIIRSITDSLLTHAQDPTSREYMAEYRGRLMLVGVEVDLMRAGEIVAHGRVEGVTDDGGLIFLGDGASEPEIIRTGEVSVRI